MNGPPPGAKYFNKLAVQVAGRRHVPVWAVVKHRGRKSGREYEAPVAVLTTPDAFIIGLPWGKGTDWVRNLRAAGGGTVHWQGRDETVTDPKFVSAEVALAAAPAVLRLALERLPGGGDFLQLSRSR
ncbi:MAG: nitroreductase family deazaflavin-dependent oxidoreductase [Knoellia sp.]